MSRTYAFVSPEMHCGACELIVERTLGEERSVRTVKADAALSTVLVEGDFDEGPDEIAARFSALLLPKGYTIAVGPAPKNPIPAAREFLVALLFAAAIIAAFVALQKVGLVNLFSPNQMNLPASFLIGVIASLSTCMALVGGLLLSVSASTSQTDKGSRFFGSAMFHVSRLGSFFMLGGVIGAIGRAFTLTPVLTVALDAAVALVMLVLGLNLLDLFPALKRFQPHMPAFLSRRLLKAEKLRHGLTPALLGLITFFLPCGFTQSMQLFSLTSGSFLNGALTMLAFAAGTFPVLALISFASVSLAASQRAGIFFKTAGLIVIAFALMNMMNSLAVLGLVRPLVGI
jgi:sulfite exporter TauE/SafE/copper chaperone CopZ